MSLKDRIKIWVYDLLYRRYDRRCVHGVTVYTYWKLKKVVVGKGYILIPLRFKRENEEQQVLVCLEAFRKAIAFRILKHG